MTRIEAEQLAYVSCRNDRENNYIAIPVGDGTWTVKPIPIHFHSCKRA
jgi:hypothetical protein